MRFPASLIAPWVLTACAGLATTTLSAQTILPTPPSEYTVRIRYRIYASPSERAAQFDEMMRYFDRLGFKEDNANEDEAEDPSESRMSGVISAANARRLLFEPHVKEILLIPQGYKLPEDANGWVHVQLELISGLGSRQPALAEQVRQRVRAIGFRENVGYDNRGHTRLLGWVPGRLLDDLLIDLRTQPGGWLTPDVPYVQTPAPLRNASPITTIEVLPGETPPKPIALAPPLPRGQEYLAKISPELTQREGLERLEILLNSTPASGDQRWRTLLEEAAPGLTIEGVLGPLVTATANAKDAPNLAALSIVSLVRAPRVALTHPGALDAASEDAARRANGLERLANLKRRGRGVGVVVIDTDFRGYQDLVGKRLPAGTRYVDLTAEENRDLQPDPETGDGGGTAVAQSVALAAPEAKLTLVRVNPACPYQLQDIAQAVNGESGRTEALDRRRAELELQGEALRRQRQTFLAERKELLENFKQDEETAARRADFAKREQELSAAEDAYHGRMVRYARLARDLAALAKTRIVACSLVWPDGYPVGGTSSLSQYFDSRPFGGALWLQAAGDTRGQTWTGLFRDADENGAMEFAPAEAKPLPGRWTTELNFLGWRAHGQNPVAELPAGLNVHLSIQWREAHDPQLYGAQDLYRVPLAFLRLVLLRQLDPQGKQLGSDEMEVVAVSQGLPQRLQYEKTYAVYEQTLNVTLPTAGRYALRLEGKAPVGLAPESINTVSGQQAVRWELWPRIFVDAPTAKDRKAGRLILLDYATAAGDLGMPADSRGVLTIGALSLSGHPEASSSTGPPMDVGLLGKPDAFTYCGSQPGDEAAAACTPAAAGLAAGVLAAGQSAGIPPSDVVRAARSRPDHVLRLP